MSLTSAPATRSPRWATPVTVLLVALVTAVPAAALSGAAAPLVLGDAGPFVRWGMPLVGVVHDLAAALTVGLLVVAAFLVREGRTTDRRGTAARLAVRSTAIWLATAAVGLVLTFAELAGMPVGTPGFLTDLVDNVWRLELTRLLVTEILLVTLLLLLASWARTRGALAWSAALALLALTPLAFTGHSASALGHETTVTGLGLHLVGLSVWVGGLMAIAMLLPVLGRALTDTVRRYSVLALWSYVAVGLSGVIFATVTLGGVGNLATPYGLVIVAKVVLLVVLGVFGWRQRRTVVDRGVDSPGRFARLASVELALMGAAVALGVVLSRTEPAVPEQIDINSVIDLTGYPMPEPWAAGRLLTTWRVDWLFLLMALTAVGLYVWGMVRLRRRGDGWPVWKLLLWVLGWGVFVYVTNGAPGVYGRVMFSVHMVEHMALMMAVPILLVPANAVTLAMRALPARRDRTLGPREVLLAVVHSRWAAFVVNPAVAGALFFGSLVVFYWSGMLEWALTTHVGHLFMVIHFTLTGYAFVWSLAGTDPGPPKWPAPFRMMVLLATLAGHAFFGLALMQGAWLLAPGFFKAIEVPWVPDLLADQQLGGTIAWGIGELPTVVLMLMVGLDWLRRDTREAVRSDRQADRDDDAELRAYNERLAAMSARTDRRSTP
ncbi:cytochrome C oxidase assembly protein [Ornithinimicrobium sp. CNJ-824]|uniref:cytochrome c oxidase assembly protein n=1 Tax=Ornithinimicrobium sp. CNJ-824 TaxID=1904966 RepID=UPI000963EEB2|nr:cytochrome c oxidase assembly protein [Ornithinimicrobium sp. CNJ-824]OLT23850.1 cytochrome C oxidase assembly protein [Ornithinimicrobium sp. CNJ-824]